MPSIGYLSNLHDLVSGFEALQVEFERLQAKSLAFENHIRAAKDSYTRTSSDASAGLAKEHSQTEEQHKARNDSTSSARAAVAGYEMDEQNKSKIELATRTCEQVRRDLQYRAFIDKQGATSSSPIDKRSTVASSVMPPISESPLEQDFTVAGTPSKLGCPFASMANRRLSAHAASVVSRLRPNGTVTPQSSAAAVNERSSPITRASSRSGQGTEPVCAMDIPKDATCPMASERQPVDLESAQGSAGVCPIRYLDDHSPEEVAKYFEDHKHELPRSHELCVKRYQSSEESIKQLDAKYGNLVSMIKGLGQKHAPLLPDKASEEAEMAQDHASNEKVRKWANTVEEGMADAKVEDGERQSHFDRPLKDIRIGESPSRPWGIQVPLEATDKSERSIVADPGLDDGLAQGALDTTLPQTQAPPGRCPFSFDNEYKLPEPVAKPRAQDKSGPRAVFMNAPPPTGPDDAFSGKPRDAATFSGPVFIGYSPEQAVSILEAMRGKGL